MRERFDMFWDSLDRLWQSEIKHGLGNEYSLRGKVPASFEEFDKVKKLNVSHSDLSILPYFKNLKKLSANRVKIEDYSELSVLHGLTELNLANSSLVDLTFLISLQNLKSLDISLTLVADFEPLSSLPKLSNLDISNLKLTNIEPLSRCKNLKTLSANQCLGLDISEISKLKKLKVLSIKNNYLDDFEFLGSLVKLECIWFINVEKGVHSPSCKNGDLSVLKKLPKLNQVGCSPDEFEKIKFWFPQKMYFDVAGKEYVVENGTQYTLVEYSKISK